MKEICLKCNKSIQYEIIKNEKFCPECGWEKNAAEESFKKRKHNKIFITPNQAILNLKIQDNFFEYKQTRYLLKDISVLNLAIVNHSTRYLFFFTRKVKVTAFKIRFQDNKKLIIRAKSGGYFTSGDVEDSAEHLHLMKFSGELTEATLQTRYQYYLDQIHERGYFMFDKTRFTNDDYAISGFTRISLHHCEIEIAPYYLRIRRKSSAEDEQRSFIRKLFESDMIVINFTDNRDVFVKLLSDYYKITSYRNAEI